MFKFLNKVKKIFFFIYIFYSFITVSCVSLKNRTGKAELIIRQERMFWEIRNNSASIFILGTIDIADRTFYPLEEDIIEAFENADFLLTGTNAQETAKLPISVKAAVFKSANIENDKNILKHLTEEECEVLYKFCGKEHTENLSMFDGWVLKLMLSEALIETQGFLGKENLNIFFLNKAGERSCEALFSAEENLQEITFGTWEEQLQLLKNKIQSVIQMSKQNNGRTELNEIKKLYLSDEREKLYYFLTHRNIEKMFNGIAPEKVEKYKELTVSDRNKRWAETLKQYLLKGGRTFVFADMIHFCGDESVFKLLEKDGILNTKNESSIVDKTITENGKKE